MSNDVVGDTTHVLPPLTQIQPEKESLAALVNVRSHNDGEQHAKDTALDSGSQSPEPQQQTLPSEVKSPVTAQIRRPSPGPSQSIPDPVLPDTQTEQIQVKTEMTDVPSQVTETASEAGAQAATSPMPASRQPSPTADGPPISKSIVELKNDASPHPSPKMESPNRKGSEKPKAAPTKKRAAPKKGTASTKKPAAKKRKIDTTKAESIPSTPALPRNETPSSSRASKTPAPKAQPQKQGSSTPARSSSVAAANEDEYEDDDSMSIDPNEQFCICRGPDDHSWMIACDGGCDDWFHGRCVDMDEKDGKLIDKYICPNCTSAGRGHTLWKPMCRLSTCRKPARVDAAKQSKYCSDEHGTEFMRQLAFKNEPERPLPAPSTVSPGGRRKSRKDNYTDNFGNGPIDAAGYEDPDADDADGACLRGGTLRPAELKTLASTTKDIAEFRKLGEGVLSPPSSTADPNTENLAHTPEEAAQLAEIKGKTNALKERKRMLDDKDAFLGMVKARAKSVLEGLKKKGEKVGVCGFDSRLAWADEEFESWRMSEEGKSALSKGTLGPVFMIKEELEKQEKGKGKENKKGGKMVNGTSGRNKDKDKDGEGEGEAEQEIDGDQAPNPPTTEEGEEEDGATKGICVKKGCRRHKDWLRVQTNNIALDKESVRVDMKRLLAEEKGLRERAMIRSLEEH